MNETAAKAGRGKGPDPGANWPLTDRPGFLLRRVHQIHGSLFAEHCGAFGMTPLQYSLLSALRDHGGVDLTTLASRVALDRTTTTGALKRLEARGLVERTTAPHDRRSSTCRLTEAGRALTTAMEPAARRAHEATLAALGTDNARRLVGLLKRIVAHHEERRLAEPP